MLRNHTYRTSSLIPALICSAFLVACNGEQAADETRRDSSKGEVLAPITIAPVLDWPYAFLSSSGRRVLVSLDSGSFHIYEFGRSGENERNLIKFATFKLPTSNGAAVVALSPDGKYAVGCDKFTIYLWDLQTLRLTHQVSSRVLFTSPIEGADEWVTNLAFRNNSTLAIQGMSQGIIEIAIIDGKFEIPASLKPLEHDLSKYRELQLDRCDSGHGYYTMNRHVLTHFPESSSSASSTVDLGLIMPLAADFTDKEVVVVDRYGGIYKGKAEVSPANIVDAFPKRMYLGAYFFDNLIFARTETEVFVYNGKSSSQLFADEHETIGSLLVVDGTLMISLVSGQVLAMDTDSLMNE